MAKPRDAQARPVPGCGPHTSFQADQVGHKLDHDEDDGINGEGQLEGLFAQVSDDSQLSGASSGVSTTHSLMELSSPHFFHYQCTEIDAKASRVVDESSIRDAISSAVGACQFCVTVADARSEDNPLIAISQKFERITGYSREEILGKNCRFLQQGCNMDIANLMALREACFSGVGCTVVLLNRRKSGELFFNLLDLRGLTVARNPRTGEDLWFLVGIQADVTNMHVPQVQTDELARIQRVANDIRSKLTDELSALAVAGALKNHVEVAAASMLHAEEPPDAWCLLPVPVWRSAGDPPPLSIAMDSLHIDNMLLDGASTEFEKGVAMDSDESKASTPLQYDRSCGSPSSTPSMAPWWLSGISSSAQPLAAIARWPGWNEGHVMHLGALGIGAACVAAIGVAVAAGSCSMRR